MNKNKKEDLINDYKIVKYRILTQKLREENEKLKKEVKYYVEIFKIPEWIQKIFK